MNEENTSSSNAALLSFLAGAAVGAIVVALTTPKSGNEVCRDIRALGWRARRRAGEMGQRVGEAWNESKDRTAQAASDLKRGVMDAANNLVGAERPGSSSSSSSRKSSMT